MSFYYALLQGEINNGLRKESPICFMWSERLYFLAFKHQFAYNGLPKLSCTEPFALRAYARENSKQLLCGLFYRQIEADLEVKMVTPLNKGWERGDVRKIKIEGEGDKEREVSVELV